MEPIIIKGNRLFYEQSGDQFFMKGIIYQDWQDNKGANTPIFLDPLEDGAKCIRDIPYLKQLGINTVHISFFRSERSHRICLTKFRDAGIYVIINLVGEIRGFYKDIDTWDTLYQRKYTAIIDSIAEFSNVLGLHLWTKAHSLPFAKAAARDLKIHLKTLGHRAIPIGFNTLFPHTFVFHSFLNCGGQDVSLDFSLYNIGQDCGPKSTTLENLKELQSIQSTFPIFITRDPCSPAEQADSDILLTAYSNNSTMIQSGGILLNYFGTGSERNRKEGLVDVKENIINPRPEFSSVASLMAQFNPSSTKLRNYTPTITIQTSCISDFSYTTTIIPIITSTITPNITPTQSSGSIALETSTVAIHLASNLPPKPDSSICTCMMETLGCTGTDMSINNGTIAEIYEMEYGINPMEKKVLSKVCSQNQTWCLGSTSNTTTGRYGAFTICNSTERISWTLNQLYQANENNASSCSSAEGAINTPITSQSQRCQFLLKQAGPDGSGQILQTEFQTKPSNGISFSTTVKAGIGVAITVLALLTVVFILLCQRRRKKRIQMKTQMETQMKTDEKPNQFEKFELPDNSKPWQLKEHLEFVGEGRVEIEGSQILEGDYGTITEMPTVHNEPVELDSTNIRASTSEKGTIRSNLIT